MNLGSTWGRRFPTQRETSQVFECLAFDIKLDMNEIAHEIWNNLLGTNTSLQKGTFEDDFPFPQVGYGFVPWRVFKYFAKCHGRPANCTVCRSDCWWFLGGHPTDWGVKPGPHRACELAFSSSLELMEREPTVFPHLSVPEGSGRASCEHQGLDAFLGWVVVWFVLGRCWHKMNESHPKKVEISKFKKGLKLPELAFFVVSFGSVLKYQQTFQLRRYRMP